MRTFLGFPCGDQLVDRLNEAQQSFPGGFDIQPIKPDNLHMTIKFLGDRSRSELDDLDRQFLRRLPTPGPFSLAVRGAGAFPDPADPSVLWAGVEQPTELEEFVDCVESISVDCGAKPESRDYHSHVTLGRVKEDTGHTDDIVQWIQEHGEGEFGRIEADHLLLFESELHENGPIYHELERWPL